MEANKPIATLISQIHSETNKYRLASLLGDLEKHQEVPLDAHLLGLANDPRWLVRHSAIQALGQCSDPEVESCLLKRAESTDDVYDLIYINASLGKMGSDQSIPHLSEMTLHRKEDVACSAIAALTNIGSIDNLPLFIERLTTGRSTIKWYAMIAINEHGDESAIEPVMARIKQILRRKRKIEKHPSELVLGLEFLWQMRERDPRIKDLIWWTLDKREGMLFENEKIQIMELIGEEESAS